MRTIFALSVCLLLNYRLTAQQNYIDYNKAIIKAERYFLNGKLDSSLMQYSQVFTKWSHPFAKDCFTALQIAAVRHDTANAAYFFNRSFEAGVNMAVINSVHAVSDLLHDAGYKKRIMQLYEPARKKYFDDLNADLRVKVLTLMQKDNANRAMPGKPRWYQDSVYAATMDEIIRDLLVIVKKTGYPGERSTGVYDDPQAHGNEYTSNRLSSLPAIFFYHHYCAYPLIQRELLQAIKDGELQPAEFALIYEWSYRTFNNRKNIENHWNTDSAKLKSYYYGNYKLNCIHENRESYYNIDIHTFFYCHDTTFVNLCRTEIGMPTLQHEMNKKRFAKDYSLRLFYGLFENL